ncbi:hypothetical protein D3C78_1118800 [compost metagenome]
MSSGLISDIPLPISRVGFQKSLFVAPVKLSTGTPSTTTNGWFKPVRELLPLNTILEEPAGPLLERTTCKPATFPESALAMLFSLVSTRFSPFTSCTA